MSRSRGGTAITGNTLATGQASRPAPTCASPASCSSGHRDDHAAGLARSRRAERQYRPLRPRELPMLILGGAQHTPPPACAASVRIARKGSAPARISGVLDAWGRGGGDDRVNHHEREDREDQRHRPRWIALAISDTTPTAATCTGGRAIHRRCGSVWCDGARPSGLSAGFIVSRPSAATPPTAARSAGAETATPAQTGSPAAPRGAQGSRRSTPEGAEARRPPRRSSPHPGSAPRDQPGRASRSSAGRGEHAHHYAGSPGTAQGHLQTSSRTSLADALRAGKRVANRVTN